MTPRRSRAAAQARLQVWALLDLGLYPIPVHPFTRHPLVPWGDLDRLGYRPGIGEARTGQLAGGRPDRWVPLMFEWWDRWPYAGAAILTVLSRLLVVDVDPRHSGHHTFARLAQATPLPATRGVRTRHGGIHLYYRTPHLVRSKGGQLGQGVDVKSHRALIVCPPTPGYSLLERHPIVPAPEWLVARCHPVSRPRAGRVRDPVPPDAPAAVAALTQALQAIKDAPPGQRHDIVYRAACRVFAITDSDHIQAALVTAARQACEPRDWRDRERAVADARAFIRGVRVHER
jgi:Bifunctional DNA primase/polymerase, N-terminal